MKLKVDDDDDIDDYDKIKCRSLTRRKKKWRGDTHITHDTQTKIIVMLTIKNEMKFKKMHNIDNTKSNNSDDFNIKKLVIIMIVIIKIVVIIIIMITATTLSQNNQTWNCINKINRLSCQLFRNKILHAH